MIRVIDDRYKRGNLVAWRDINRRRVDPCLQTRKEQHATQDPKEATKHVDIWA